ncbi:MAG: hypothetical protein GY859_03305 [Desulfobacterales bacterium]|nr:hypothetical protein [Desulfobacterales bacterium]
MDPDPGMQSNNDSPPDRGLTPATVIAVWIAIYYTCFFLFSRVSFPGEIMAMAVSALVCTLSALGALVFLVKRSFTRSRLIFLLILCACADIGVNLALQRLAPPGGGAPHVPAGINLTLMGVAFCAGVLLSRLIQKPSYIIPLAAAAALADAWSVTLGPTHAIVQSRVAMNFLLFSFPVAGKGVLPIIGVTDFVFAAMFLSLSRKFHIPEGKTRLLLAASFVASIGVAVVGGFGVPVLPVMGLFFIVGNYRHVAITDPREKRDAALGLLIIAAALAVVTWIKN